MGEREQQQRVWDIESILSDATDCGDDPDGRGYQSSGITKLAELLAGYEQRIADLEAKLAAQPRTE
ncbi:hypothetical protein [Streptomyces sp. FL07-04A]|uniref:hypothetical protein n=1 Tax=Streptomyces sp. FL07-04A TaxID=3028658 RepID=UPI0029BE9262|nr:hypothetical protein [Streptomyces sp. FL07-04A]MDX3575972.1 hypothetical protein [Streptomyces sp. FL07-04A]